jgi:hypothetical protein
VASRWRSGSATFSIIWAGGFTDRAAAEAALDTGLVDLIAFGRPYKANPDLGERLKHGWSLAEADPSTYYTRRSVPRLVARTAVWRGATSMTIIRLSRPSPIAEHLGGFPGLAENAAARPNTKAGLDVVAAGWCCTIRNLRPHQPKPVRDCARKGPRERSR